MGGLWSRPEPGGSLHGQEITSWRRAMVVFVCGHLNVTDAEFHLHYVPRLAAHLTAGDSFVVGDARGADTLAQRWLFAHNATVTVYHMFDSPRFNAGFPTRGGFRADDERDRAMTEASDIDVAWVRPGRE